MSNLKKNSQTIHFMKRIKERTDFEYSRELKEIFSSRRKTDILLYRQSNRVRCYLIEYNGEVFIMYYDIVTKRPITIYTKEMFTQNHYDYIKKVKPHGNRHKMILELSKK